LHLQTERRRVLADNRGREKARHVKDVLVSKPHIEFAAVGGEGADTALLVLIVN
jgi:outer membrane cobalamin receptor